MSGVTKYCPIDAAIMTANLDQDPPVWTCDECPIEIPMTQEEIDSFDESEE